MLKYIKYFFRLIKENFCFNNITDKNIKINFSENNDFRVLTFNIRRDSLSDGQNNWIYRRDAIIDMIQEYHPDIICFQEIMPHMAKFLISKLGEFYDNYGIEIFTNHKLDKSNFLFGEGLMTLWRKDLFTFQDKTIIKLFDKRIINLRRFVDITLINKQNDEIIHVINTHFCHLSKQAQNKSFHKLYSYVNNLNSIFYACGDYNTDKTYRDTDISLMMNKFSYNYKHNPSDGTINLFSENRYGAVIDYIFSNNQLIDFEIITKNFGNIFLSDHYAVLNTY